MLDQEVWFTGLIPNANGQEWKTRRAESEYDTNIQPPKTQTFTFQGMPITPELPNHDSMNFGVEHITLV